AAYANEVAAAGADIVGPKYWDWHRRGVPLRVAGDITGSPGARFEPRCSRAPLRKDVSEKLRSFAEAQDVTLESIVTACWTWLLTNSGGAHDVVIGYVCSGRTDSEMSSAVGLYERTVPVRLQIRSNEAWRAVVQRVHAQLQEVNRSQATYVPEPG